jgi:hypothetical protein
VPDEQGTIPRSSDAGDGASRKEEPMSWLGANEVFLMEVVSREHVEDLRSAVDMLRESAVDADTPCETTEGWPSMSVARA